MSISGTGTQADPFIVDEWADFVTAITTTDAYVEVDTSEVSVWDFPKIVEGGITSAIVITAAEIDGKGLTIKGLFGTAAQWFQHIGTGTLLVIKNLNFLDFSKSAVSSSGVFYGTNTEFRRCKFSGEIEGGEVFRLSGTTANMICTTGTLDGEDPKGCSFAIKFSGNAKLCTNSYAVFKHCNFNFDGSSTSSMAAKFHDCKISGAMPWASFTNAGGGQNVIDADISAIDSWSNSSGGVTLVNTDKLASGLSVPTGFTGVTSAQMLDVDALAAVGFIAVEESEPSGE